MNGSLVPLTTVISEAWENAHLKGAVWQFHLYHDGVRSYMDLLPSETDENNKNR